jgi:hypothetical protein
MNIQDGNVGNRGDLRKHEALAAILDTLAAASSGPVLVVETHCFRLDAALPRPTAPMNARLTALQAPWAARGRYRCSAGLACDILGDRARLLLAEADGPTRAALSDALVSEGRHVVALVDDAAALVDFGRSVAPAAVFIHVDPFDHPRYHWPVVEALLDRWRSADTPCAVLAFAYDKAGPIVWPGAPAGLPLCGSLADPPYGLAVWSTLPIPLGW